MPITPGSTIGPAMQALARMNEAVTRTDAPVDITRTSSITRLDQAMTSSRSVLTGATHGIGILEVGEQQLDHVGSLLNRASQLELAASNGALNTRDRAAISAERETLLTEAREVLGSARYAGDPLFERAGLDTSALTAALESSGDPSAAQTALSDLRAAVSGQRAAVVARIDSAQTDLVTLGYAREAVDDGDLALSIAEQVREELLARANIAVFDRQQFTERTIIDLLG